MSENDIQYPKMYEYCLEAYNYMLNNKSTNELDGKPIYRGHLTKDLENNIGITTAQYSRTINNLKDMQCIIQVRRGAGNVPSEWALIRRPTMELFEEARGEVATMRKRKPNYTDQRIKDLARRVAVIERELWGDE